MRQSILFVILALGGLFMAYGAKTYCPDSIVDAKAYACSATALATNTANVLSGATSLPFISATQAAVTVYATITVGTACTSATGALPAEIAHLLTFQQTPSGATSAVNLIDFYTGTSLIGLRGVTATDTAFTVALPATTPAATDVYQLIAVADTAAVKLTGAIGTSQERTVYAGNTAIASGYVAATHKFDLTTKVAFCANTDFTKFAACTVSLRVEKTAQTTLAKGLLWSLDGSSHVLAQYLFKERTGTSVANQVSTTNALKAAQFGDAKTATTLPTWPTSGAGVTLTATSYVIIPTVVPSKDPISGANSLQITFWIKQETLAAGIIWQILAADGTTVKAKISIDASGVITGAYGTVTNTGTAIVVKAWTFVSVYLSPTIVTVDVGQAPATYTGTPATAATVTFAATDLHYLGATSGAAVATLQDVRVLSPGSLTWNSPSCASTTCTVSLGLTPNALCLASGVCPSQTTGTDATSCTYTPDSFINTDLSVLQIIAISLAGVGLAGLIA